MLKDFAGSIVLTAVLALGLFAASCAGNKPPNLNPEATKAWYGTEIIKNLDRVRDAANDAHQTNPPLIDAPTTLKIVEWHQSAIKVVHDGAVGWREALTASIGALQRNLPPQTWQLIQPYVLLVQNIIKELQAGASVPRLEAA